MNMLDMYTRDNANQLHLEKMRRDRPYRSLLRGMNSTRNLATFKWMRLMLILSTIVLLPGSFLLTSGRGFKSMNIGAKNATLIRTHTA